MFNVPFVLEIFPDIGLLLEFIISSAGKEFRKSLSSPLQRKYVGALRIEPL
jgi:hypothetical protein